MNGPTHSRVFSGYTTGPRIFLVRQGVVKNGALEKLYLYPLTAETEGQRAYRRLRRSALAMRRCKPSRNERSS